MFKTLGKIFGTDSVIEKGMEIGDEIFYTKQEQASDDIKKSNYKLAFMKQYEAYKLAQRLIALVITCYLVVVSFILLCAQLYVMFMFWENPEAYDFFSQQLKDIASYQIETFGTAFMFITGFYYGGGFMEGVVTRYMNGRIAQTKVAQ